jgi:hypothetical protein
VNLFCGAAANAADATATDVVNNAARDIIDTGFVVIERF